MGEQDQQLTFGSEDERIAAMEKLGDSQDSLAELERIRNAAIVEKAEGQEAPDAGQTGPQPQAVNVPAPAAAPSVPTTSTAAAATPEVLSLSAKALRDAGFTYGTPEDVIKGLSEKEKYIKELQEQALEEEAKEDPYNRTNPEFLQRQAKLIDLQTQAMERIADFSVQAATSAERREAERRAAVQRAEETELYNKLRLQTFAEMDSVGNDPELSEYKLPAKAVELEAEYIRWRSDVAAAYYGGAVNDPDPKRRDALEAAALHQLEVKNPDLVKKCQLHGIPAEPSQGVRSYLALVDNLAYRDGWRPDPANPGNFVQLTRYDSATKKEVPVLMPDLATAIKHRRLEEGVYKQQVADAYQRGAQTFAAAQAKRDPTVAELNHPSTIGSSGNAGAEWAAQYLENVNEEEAIRRYRNGDRTMIDEINKARAVFDMPPLDNL